MATFTTSDGVQLFYRVGGQGAPLVMLPGMGGTTESFAPNYPELEKHFTVYSLDYRFHGRSETPDHGYHLERFAMDLHEFLDAMHLSRVYLLAHSMGNAVTWSYITLFGCQRIEKYVLDDESPCLLRPPEWTEEEQLQYTGLWDWKQPFQPFGHLTEPHTDLRTEMMLRLFREHLSRDWRDTLPRIACKTLILMGGGSHFASPLLWDWMHRTIPGSQLAVIPKEEGGSHGMHEEASPLFNRIVLQFLSEDTVPDGYRR